MYINKGLKDAGSDVKNNVSRGKGAVNLDVNQNVMNNQDNEFEDDNQNYKYVESKNAVSLNQRVTSDQIIKNLAEINQNSQKNSKKNSKTIAKEEVPIINTSNNETILSMKIEPEAIEMKIINGIKSNTENSIFISSQNN